MEKSTGEIDSINLNKAAIGRTKSYIPAKTIKSKLHYRLNRISGTCILTGHAIAQPYSQVNEIENNMLIPCLFYREVQRHVSNKNENSELQAYIC